MLYRLTLKCEICNLHELLKLYELCRLYELCKLYEFFMNCLKYVEITERIIEFILNVIFIVFKNFSKHFRECIMMKNPSCKII